MRHGRTPISETAQDRHQEHHDRQSTFRLRDQRPPGCRPKRQRIEIERIIAQRRRAG